MATILVIDDETDIGETLQSLLQLDGFDVILASDGSCGLMMLDKVGWSCVDLVITDMVMPELDGLGFLRAYHQHSEAKAPVLAMSSLEAYLDAALDLGAAATLRKPFEIRDLTKLVRALIGGAETPQRVGVTPSDPRAEQRRLELIDEIGLEAATIETLFQPFVDRVADTFQVPICLLSIIDQSRQYWSAGCGIPAAFRSERGSPREDSFCTHAVEARAPLIVQNAADNPVFADNLFVRTEHFRFYAGVPVLTLSGEAVGTLCVLDYQPRSFTHNELRLLALFARRATAEVGRRERLSAAISPAVADDYGHVVDEETGVFARPAFMELVGIEAARKIEQRQTLWLAVIDIEPRAANAVVGGLEAAVRAGWLGRLSYAQLGLLLSSVDPDEALNTIRTVVGASGTASIMDLTGRLASGLDLIRLATMRQRNT